MLATAVPMLPVGTGWSYEFKWDGVRALLDIGGAGVRIISRNGNDVTPAYPELVALAAQEDDALVDGEIVAFVDGRPSFERLQTRMHVRSKVDAARLADDCPVAFVAFDLLRRYGVDLTSRPWHERRATLERWLANADGWTLSPAFDDGPATEQVARAHGLEGVVAKRSDAPYRPGTRSNDWRKLRFLRGGDFVVIGWEGPTARPDDLTSLIVACRRDGELTFAGKVGSGLSGAITRRLRPLLEPRPAPVVPGVSRSAGRVLHWTEPTVVVEIEFVAWTNEGRLRHPVFRGIRTDKRPEEANGDA
jgi:bifunctional non-homologous end joining protein LigD